MCLVWISVAICPWMECGHTLSFSAIFGIRLSDIPPKVLEQYQSYPIRVPSHDCFQSQVVDFISGKHDHFFIMWDVSSSGSGNWMESQWVSCTRGNSSGTNAGGWTMLPQMLDPEMGLKRRGVLW